MLASYVKALTAKGLTTTLLAAASCLVQAQELQKLADIQLVAEQFARSQLGNAAYEDVLVVASTLDPRLRLSQCDHALEAFATNAGVRAGRTTVGVRCPGASPWTLYVPLQINASVSVVTLTGPLQRGSVITAQNLTLASKPFSSLPTVYITDLSDVLGKELTRNLSADTVLAPAMLKEHPLISKGQEVLITASSANFEVKMAGTALQPGAIGQRINVKNNNSGRTVQAVIVDSHTVKVQF